jgi:hypothetical protein
MTTTWYQPARTIGLPPLLLSQRVNGTGLALLTTQDVVASRGLGSAAEQAGG